MDKLTCKSSVRPELSGIYFTPEKMVATDTYRLNEVKKTIALEGASRVIKAKGFRGRGSVVINKDNLVKDDGKLIQGEVVGDPDAYPKYEQIFDELAEPKCSMKVNAKYLSELAAEVAAETKEPFDAVRLDFYDEYKPLVIRSEHRDVKVRAALSPMTR